MRYQWKLGKYNKDTKDHYDVPSGVKRNTVGLVQPYRTRARTPFDFHTGPELALELRRGLRLLRLPARRRSARADGAQAQAGELGEREIQNAPPPFTLATV